MVHALATASTDVTAATATILTPRQRCNAPGSLHQARASSKEAAEEVPHLRIPRGRCSFYNGRRAPSPCPVSLADAAPEAQAPFSLLGVLNRESGIALPMPRTGAAARPPAQGHEREGSLALDQEDMCGAVRNSAPRRRTRGARWCSEQLAPERASERLGRGHQHPQQRERRHRC